MRYAFAFPPLHADCFAKKTILCKKCEHARKPQSMRVDCTQLGNKIYRFLFVYCDQFYEHALYNVWFYDDVSIWNSHLCILVHAASFKDTAKYQPIFFIMLEVAHHLVAVFKF